MVSATSVVTILTRFASLAARRRRNGLFFAMFGAGVVLFICLISINYWGAKTFRRARNWLHGDGGAHIILLEDNEINLIFAAVFAVCTSTLVAFFAQSVYFIEEADY